MILSSQNDYDLSEYVIVMVYTMMMIKVPINTPNNNI